MERTLLTEAISTDACIGVLWCSVVAIQRRRRWHEWLLAPGALLLGVATTMKPALTVTSICILGLAAAAVWLLSGVRRWSWVRVGHALALSAAIGAAFLIPVVAQAEANNLRFHDFSIDPGGSTFLFTRWGPLLGCNARVSDEAEVTRKAVAEVCDIPFTPVPGQNLNEVWQKLPVHMTAYAPELRRTQGQLQSLALSAMADHPGMVLSQVWQSLWYQVFDPPIDDTSQYSNLDEETAHEFASNPDFTWIRPWLGSAAPKGLSAQPGFVAWSRAAMRWPQYLIWLGLALGAVQLAIRLRIGVIGLRLLGTGGRKRRGRLTAASISAVIVLGSFLANAVSGEPVWRYLVNLVPFILVLVALGTIPPQRQDAGAPAK